MRNLSGPVRHEEILFQARPHIGTDNLIKVVKNLRNSILSLGGQCRFETTLTDIVAKKGRICGAVVNHAETIATSHLVLALGHSARDTFHMLYEYDIPMEAKPFSMGVRIEHPQRMIDQIQYGSFASHPALGPSDYRLVHHCPNGRTAYTFCMCPGGRVIASSSETGGIVTNGMSLYARNSPNANSALLVGVSPSDYEGAGPLSGVLFQRTWEQKAFRAGRRQLFCAGPARGRFPSEQGINLRGTSNSRVTLRALLPGICRRAFRTLWSRRSGWPSLPCTKNLRALPWPMQ